MALRSDLKLPEPVFAALSIYLMLAIGLKGGVELSGRSLSELAAPVAGVLVLACAIPLWCFALLRRFVGLSVPDAAALSAHYSCVSAVTFAAVSALLDRQGMSYEGYAPAFLAIMEVPAIVIAIGLAGVAALTSRAVSISGNGLALVDQPSPISPVGGRMAGALAEVLSSRACSRLDGLVGLAFCLF